MKHNSFETDDILSELGIDEFGLEQAPDGEVSRDENEQIISGGANGR